MKKLALFLALIMVVAACVIPVSAADETKTISFEAHNGDSAYLVADKSTVNFGNPDNGDEYYFIDEGEQLVFKFTLEGNASSAKIAMPALGFYEVWAGSTIEGAKKVYTSLQSFNDGYTAGSTDNWSTKGLAADQYTSVFEPLLDEIDLTSALDGTTLYVILKCTNSDQATGIWATAHAVKNSVKYVNRRWNLVNNFSKNGGEEGSRTSSDAVSGEKYSDGMITLTYTVAPAAPAEKKFVKMLDFDEKYFGTLDEENQIDGTGCNTFTFKETSGTEVFQRNIENPIDISGCDFVEFYFYCSDISKLDQFTGAQIELCSDGGCDRGEMTFDISGAGLKNRIVGEPQNGWNLVRLDLNAPSAKHTTGGTDAAGKPFDAYNPAHINYFRMYTLQGNKFAGVTMKWDYLYAYAEGAEIPAPQKAAAQTDAPATQPTVDPQPTTFDAASSIAVVAVAAMGVVLVASKKRH